MDNLIKIFIRKKKSINKKNGEIPCIIYNKKINISCYIPLLEAKKIIKNRNYIIKIKLINKNNNNKEFYCLIKDIQYNIFKTKILHFDFYKIEKKIPFKFTANVKTIGNSIGISKGGICNIVIRKIKIFTTLNNYFKEFIIDITSLDIGNKIYIKDLLKDKPIKNIKILHPLNSIVLTITVKKINKDD
ncbi:MAG: 50S ribosomal protein L25 [Candidatus Shikimatogenerans bostrichidophilus]|nr:MAG: 50S ribosomal protein L25 [Candidatus Shikimatogenerans bostrichidophilus]